MMGALGLVKWVGGLEQGSPRVRVDSPGDLRLVRSSGLPKAGRKPPGPGVLRVSFLTRGEPVPGHKFLYRSRASPAYGRASLGLSGHPGDTGAVGRDCATHRITGHPGTRWNWVRRCPSADPIPPNDIHRVICCSLPLAPGGHRSTGGHRARKMHRKTFTGGFVEIYHRPPVGTGRPVDIGPEKCTERHSPGGLWKFATGPR